MNDNPEQPTNPAPVAPPQKTTVDLAERFESAKKLSNDLWNRYNLNSEKPASNVALREHVKADMREMITRLSEAWEIVAGLHQLLKQHARPPKQESIIATATPAELAALLKGKAGRA